MNNRELLIHIAGLLGVATLVPAACGGKAVIDGAASAGGAGGTDSGSTTSSPSANGVGGGIVTGGSGGGGGNGECAEARYPNRPIPNECFDPAFSEFLLVCFPSPDGDASCESTHTDACILDAYSCGLQMGGDAITCGPLPNAMGRCCYVVAGNCPVGRPFTVGGVARVAHMQQGASDWCGGAIVHASSLNPSDRAALADYYLEQARREHASVASFSRFVLQLLSLGAPADLIGAAQKATQEELAHAQICLALARDYGQREWRPLALDVRDALGDCDLHAVVISAVVEGCIAETVAAQLAQQASERVRDRALAASLTRIATEEAEHALLAWRAVGWMLAQAPQDAALRTRVREAFESAADHVGLGPTTDLPARRSVLIEHGYVPVQERRRLAHTVLREVIEPSARMLLADSQVLDEDTAGPPRDLLMLSGRARA